MEKGGCRDEWHQSCHDWNSSDEKRESEPTNSPAKSDFERDDSDYNKAGCHYAVSSREKLISVRGVEGTRPCISQFTHESRIFQGLDEYKYDSPGDS